MTKTYLTASQTSDSGGRVGTSKQGSLYQSSWQQADSLSPQNRLAAAEAAVPPGGKQVMGDSYLSKQKSLFASKMDSSPQARSTGGHSTTDSHHRRSTRDPPPNSSREIDPKASIPLTGDPRADADILAFYKARQKLIRELK